MVEAPTIGAAPLAGIKVLSRGSEVLVIVGSAAGGNKVQWETWWWWERRESIRQVGVRMIIISFFLISAAQIFFKYNGGRVYANFCTRSTRCKEPSILQCSSHICKVSKCQSVRSIFQTCTLILRHLANSHLCLCRDTLIKHWHIGYCQKALNVTKTLLKEREKGGASW